MSPKQVIIKWVHAFNQRDAAFGIPLKGRDEIFQDFKQFFEQNPDNETHVVSLNEVGEWAFLE